MKRNLVHVVRVVQLVLFAVLLAMPALGQITGVGSITAQGTTCATTNACVVIPLPNGASAASIQLSGTFSSTNQFEVSADGGTTWFAALGIPPTSASAVSSTTATGMWTFQVGSFTNLRVRSSTYASGTVSVNWSVSTGPSNYVLASVQFPNVAGTDDPCANPHIIPTRTAITDIAATTKIVSNGGAGTFIHVCGISANFGGTGAANIKFTSGTGAACGTSTANLTGTYTGVLGTNVVIGFGGRLVLTTNAAAQDFCIAVSGGSSPIIGGFVSTITQ